MKTSNHDHKNISITSSKDFIQLFNLIISVRFSYRSLVTVQQRSECFAKFFIDQAL